MYISRFQLRYNCSICCKYTECPLKELVDLIHPVCLHIPFFCKAVSHRRVCVLVLQRVHFCNCQTISVLPYLLQTREQVPSETHPVWDSSVPPNSGGSRAADASNATAPLFARPTSMGQPRNAESTRVQKGSPLFAMQSTPASTPKETLKDEEPPSFAKPATLKVSKKGNVTKAAIFSLLV